MNDEKEERKDEVKEVNKGGRTAVAVAATLFSGLVIGFVTGVLFAPKKGEKTYNTQNERQISTNWTADIGSCIEWMRGRKANLLLHYSHF